MDLSERVIFVQAQAFAGSRPVQGSPRSRAEIRERDARRSLRLQIAKLERQFADAFVTAYPMGGFDLPAGAPAEPRLLGLEELERVRDDLAERLRGARLTITERGDEQSANRLLLERMLLEPAKYRFARVARRDLGEAGCGVWQVRPRLGLIGMLMGWWRVKLSSGCPLARGGGSRRDPLRVQPPLSGPPARQERRLSRVTVARNSVNEFPAPINSVLNNLTAGPDGNMWFTASGAIGKITPAGMITESMNMGLPSDFSTGQPGSGTDGDGLIAGPDGNLWFNDLNTPAVAKIGLDQVPVAGTGSASAITTSGAVGSGAVTPLSSETTVLFRYGTSPSLGSTSASSCCGRAPRRGRSPPPRPPVTIPPPQATSATAGNQRLTLITPSLQACTARAAELVHTLKVVAEYRRTLRRHGHKVKVITTTTVTVKFVVCRG